MKQRSIILSENGQQIFRYDAIKNSNDDLENEIATFIVQLERSKNMINSKKVITRINKLKHFGIDTIFDFFSDKDNIDRFAKELQSSTDIIKSDLKVRFTRKNIRQNLLEALNETF